MTGNVSSGALPMLQTDNVCIIDGAIVDYLQMRIERSMPCNCTAEAGTVP